MSLRLRLTLWYGGLTGVVVLLVSLLTYAVHTRAHYDDVDRVLAASTTHVAEEYLAAPLDARATILAAPVTPTTVMRLYERDGQPRSATRNATLAPAIDPRAVLNRPVRQPFGPLVGLAPPLVAVAPGAGVFGLVTAPDGVRWRVYVLPLADARGYLVGLASLEAIDASVTRFRQLILLFTVTGAVLTLVSSWFLAGRALRPVALLTDTASAIARSREFARRVPVTADRDELGRLAATFNEMLTSLEQAYQAQQRFVADASHELRAPLTAIQANLELLERQVAMPPGERQEAVAEASREARRLARLVADLLALARADAGVALHRQRVDLDGVVLETLGQARLLARGHHLEVERLEPVVVEGDPDRLQQLLLVLLDNALKYTPGTGRVTLALRREAGVAEVRVRDTGIGIPPDELPRVFERFYRADPARARDPGGTGLGLAIAQWIARQHGGQLVLESQPGHGTTAILRLPVLTRVACSSRSPDEFGQGESPAVRGRS